MCAPRQKGLGAQTHFLGTCCAHEVMTAFRDDATQARRLDHPLKAAISYGDSLWGASRASKLVSQDSSSYGYGLVVLGNVVAGTGSDVHPTTYFVTHS